MNVPSNIILKNLSGAELKWRNFRELFQLSNHIINQKSGFFGPAYNLSYTDVHDFAAKKQSLI